MHAVRLATFGPPENLVWTEVPDPVPGPDEVVIAVEAAGVNRLDVLFRSGGYHRGAPLPAIPGVEGAGTIAALGARVRGLEVGQRVLGWGATGAPGFYAERAALDAGSVVIVPDRVDLGDAAGLPTAWLSAYYCLVRLGVLQAGQSVLVPAAASGVGSAAVQIATGLGARVLATAGSAAKREWLAGIDGVEVLDPGAGGVAAATLERTDGRGVDVVLDLVGGATFAAGLKAVARGGRVVALANVELAPSTIDTRDFYPRNVSIHGFQINDLRDHGWDSRPDLLGLLDGVATGRFAVPRDSTFAFADAADAHRRLESRLAIGKIVLSARDTADDQR
ncbi:quinone oxidoreductase family protein [Pseudonocardia sp. GCM10023141]|uniref:quinone oxidoreductase family protein n=1 Tax=Pseudonocardia sp. GCM10023141 TaxID=3252653 RepID=UPI00361850D5